MLLATGIYILIFNKHSFWLPGFLSSITEEQTTEKLFKIRVQAKENKISEEKGGFGKSETEMTV